MPRTRSIWFMFSLLVPLALSSANLMSVNAESKGDTMESVSNPSKKEAQISWEFAKNNRDLIEFCTLVCAADVDRHLATQEQLERAARSVRYQSLPRDVPQRSQVAGSHTAQRQRVFSERRVRRRRMYNADRRGRFRDEMHRIPQLVLLLVREDPHGSRQPHRVYRDAV